MTGKFIMRLITLASGPAIALLLAIILVDVGDGKSEVMEGLPDASEPLHPSHATTLAPRPIPRTDALLAALLDDSKGPFKKYDLRQLAGPSGADPLAADLLKWQSLHGGAGGWTAVSQFLKDKPGWPGADKLRNRAELIMPESAPAKERLAFFAERRPTTGRGARLYGEALIATGDAEAGKAEIIRGWREEPTTPAEEKIYLAKHGALIAPHHVARFEMLMWRERFSAASRLGAKLPADYVALRTAVRGLLRRARGVDKLIDKVPESLRDYPVLTYARMVWREGKKRRSAAEAAIVAATKAGKLGNPRAWAKKRLAFVRKAWDERRYKDAVELAENHGLSRGVEFAELEWLAGWTSLSQLKNPHRALRHFSTLYNGVVTPISRSRGAYWAGLAAQQIGDAKLAGLWFRRAAAYPTAFYGQMAIEKLAKEVTLREHADPRVFRAMAGLKGGEWTLKQRELARAAARLYRGGDKARGGEFAQALAAQSRDAAAFTQLASLARRYGDAAGEIKIAQAAYTVDVKLWGSLYPIPLAPAFTGRKVEPALLLAIARQESRFRVAAQSHVGARGLMQLMPATARGVAKRVGVAYDIDRLFTSPEYNLTLGDRFLHDMIRFFDGSYVLAIAAYNGGPGNVLKWIKKYGDPRDPKVDVITWIESIPFAETRNYVMRVMEGMQVYRLRLKGGRGHIRMSVDLERGAKKARKKP
ncbi:MAG: lytic transglycosylase domain-containing protein [Neomegalonema sp.]|nr:lytic transglycosylase domain-containing protein [Neomegalonema sp.]